MNEQVRLGELEAEARTYMRHVSYTPHKRAKRVSDTYESCLLAGEFGGVGRAEAQV